MSESNSTSSNDNAEFEQKCPICLEQFTDPALLDVCFHKFCFECICVWVARVPSCPLCKRSFKSIIHRIVTEHEYERESLESVLRIQRQSDQRKNVHDTSSGRARSATTDNVADTRRRSTSAASLSTAGTHTTARNRTVGRSSGLSRREIYAQLRRVKPLQFGAAANLLPSAEVVSSLSGGGNSFISDSLQRHNRLEQVAQQLGSLWGKLEPFVERDLKVLTGSDDVTVLSLLVKSLVTQYNVRRTRDAHQHLAQYLPRDKVDIFFNELVAFAAAPFNMAAYDRMSTYFEPMREQNVIEIDERSAPPRHRYSDNGDDNDDDDDDDDRRHRHTDRSGRHRVKRRRRRRSSSTSRLVVISDDERDDSTAVNVNHSSRQPQSTPTTTTTTTTNHTNNADDERRFYDSSRRSTFCSCRDLRSSDRRTKCDACMEIDYLRRKLLSLDEAIEHERKSIQELQTQ